MFNADLCKSPNFKWFGLALQALVVLSRHDDEPCPSHAIAKYVKSEATLLRRILSQLALGGILETREGRVGGYRLNRPPGEITLAEVYLAMEAKDLCWSGMLEAVGPHEFGKEIKGPFEQIIGRINNSTLEVLSEYTIEDLSRSCEIPTGL
ncbi:RrF2 family transcriptional regulator [Paenibacillus pinistramenti]|uniref:RrF2 family transcriptional regulator n=1 Tax=Paenibacillus pinistramenti TaxID=1768003 RepID=UPI001109097B|nr:Rrf2 family transcriptional regulator [Paenibacillus pinistramenti]